ncbi:hypothetical protein B0T14DRAFT_580142 [Immersiella caudata]|uniref:Translation elongation factor EFG/EF2 domain-containing protein n=1 Tax=Immersiella caudata TaxID=314043 RepID=A0AA40C889_9PEZI|nr:hypothetical protein B0T14DRAFT_580142 [Immersiella caudata]
MDKKHLRNVALFWKGGRGATSLSKHIELIADGLAAGPNQAGIVVHSVIPPDLEPVSGWQDTLTDPTMTSFRMSLTKTSATAESESTDSDTNTHKDSFLINLIHTSTDNFVHQSAWMAEGAILVVDLFSRVTQETSRLLRLLIAGGMKIILFIDRLELSFDSGASSEDIYVALSSIVDSVNAFIASYSDDPDVDLRVSVEDGSVLFGSLHLDWGFSIGNFVKLYSGTDDFGGVEMPLTSYFWGDKFFDPTTNSWSEQEASTDGRKLERGFNRFILDPLQQMHRTQDTPQADKHIPGLPSLMGNLHLAVQKEADISPTTKIPDGYRQSLFSAWHNLLKAAVLHLPSPVSRQKVRPQIVIGEPKPNHAEGSVPKDESSDGLSLFLTKLTATLPTGAPLIIARIVSGTLTAPTELPAHLVENPMIPWKRRLFRLRIQHIYLTSGCTLKPIHSASAGHIVALCLEKLPPRLPEALQQSILVHNLTHHFPRLESLSMPPIRRSISIDGGFDDDSLEAITSHCQHLTTTHPGLQVIELEPTAHDPLLTLSHPNDETLDLAITTLRQTWPLPDKLPIVSSPFVTYAETTTAPSSPTPSVKSTNRRIRIFIHAQPLTPDFATALETNTLRPISSPSPTDTLEDNRARTAARATARRLWRLDPIGVNAFADETKSVQYLMMSEDALCTGFNWACARGPLAGEPLRGVRVELRDFATIAEFRHRGAGQVIPAARKGVYAGVLLGSPRMLRPVCGVVVDCAREYGGVVREVLGARREEGDTGVDVREVLGRGVVECGMGVEGTIGLRAELKDVVRADAFLTVEFVGWEMVEGDPFDAESKAGKLVREIRARKGMEAAIPPAETVSVVLCFCLLKLLTAEIVLL